MGTGSDEVLKRFRDLAANERTKGMLFDRLIDKYLLTGLEGHER